MVLTSLVTKIQVFWNVTSCRQRSSYRRCGEAQWFHLQHQAVQKESTTLFRKVETPTRFNKPDDVNLHIIDRLPTYFRKSLFSPCRKLCRITDMDITISRTKLPLKSPFPTYKQCDSLRRWLQKGEPQELSRTILRDKCTEFVSVKGITAKSNFK